MQTIGSQVGRSDPHFCTNSKQNETYNRTEENDHNQGKNISQPDEDGKQQQRPYLDLT